MEYQGMLSELRLLTSLIVKIYADTISVDVRI